MTNFNFEEKQVYSSDYIGDLIIKQRSKDYYGDFYNWVTVEEREENLNDTSLTHLLWDYNFKLKN